MARLAQMGARIATFDGRRIKPPPKTVDPLYNSPEYREWRETVISRAGGRCEVVQDGRRCWRAAPSYTVYADHIEEVRDGGARFDPANGMCKCASHHSAKTAQARADRR